MITLVAAMDEDRLIGRGTELPWHVPEDLRLFRKRTMGGTLIMGRATWQHLPGNTAYLDGRVNFVVTRSPTERQANVERNGRFDTTCGPHFVDTIELAVSRARREFPEYVGEFFLIGGREIYELALRRNLVDRMVITHVAGKHMGDVYFPDFGGEWVGRSELEGEGFEIIEYVRRP